MSAKLETNLQTPQNPVRKRRSSKAMREELRSRKVHIKQALVEDTEDDKESDHEEKERHVLEMLKTLRLDRRKREEEGRKKHGWVKNTCSVMNREGRVCVTCNIPVTSKDHRECIDKRCKEWADGLPQVFEPCGVESTE